MRAPKGLSSAATSSGVDTTVRKTELVPVTVDLACIYIAKELCRRATSPFVGTKINLIDTLGRDRPCAVRRGKQYS